jgi:opacity protein-like surface antigen
MGAADYKLNDWFSIRGLVGVEQFNAKANSVTNAGVVYDTKITYFSGTAWGRFIFATNLWLGAGLGIQQPLSTSTNALDESSLGTSLVYGVGGGADIAVGTNMYVPVQLEYGVQPKSDSVAPSYYGVRVGLMLRY